MKVLLIKDVYKLGRAGDIKKVANGYGRNYLVPQGFAIPATENSAKVAESIAKKATERRAVLNHELKSVAEVLETLELFFPVKAGETGKLYGSVSAQNIIDRIIKGDLHITEETIVNREIISVRTTKEKYNELVKIAGEHGITIQGLLRMGIEQFNLGTSSQK